MKLGSIDKMNRPNSGSSRLANSKQWSSQEKLKTREHENEKSQFYTPVRSRRRSPQDNPMASLPPLPPSEKKSSNKKETGGATFDDMPALPPRVVTDETIHQLPAASDSLLTSTPRPPSVAAIEDILKTSSEPNLLNVGNIKRASKCLIIYIYRMMEVT